MDLVFYQGTMYTILLVVLLEYYEQQENGYV